MTTTNQGVENNNFDQVALSEDDAAAAILSRWSEKEPEDNVSSSEDPEARDEEEEALDEGEAVEEEVEAEEGDEDPQEEESEETEEGDEEESEEDEPKKAKKSLDDDAVVKVKVKVDDEELEVSVKDLKRLYGQEAALTRKSQQVAEKRKAVEADSTRLAASLDRLYKQAEERYKPYAEIDMLVASKQLDAESFAALRQEAKAAYDDYRFITEEVNQYVTQQREAQRTQQQEAAKEAVKVLKERITGWDEKLYNSIREYAISQGMDPVMVNSVTNPQAIEMMHKARLYDESKKIATTKKVATPKKIIKTTSSTVSVPKAEKAAKQVARLRSSGSTDDAADVLLNRWMRDE